MRTLRSTTLIRFAVLAACFSLLSSPLHSATRTWDGGGGLNDNFYDVAANWSDNVAPLATDHIVFSLPGTTTVLWDDLTDNTTSATLNVNAGAVNWLTFADGPFTHTVTGSVNVNNGSTFRITNHTLATQGFFDVLNNGTLVADSTGVVNAFDMTIGLGSAGSLNVINGGRVNVSQSPILGEGNGGNGNATVSNASSAFMATKNLILGQAGTTGKGTFTTSDSGQLGIGSSGVTTAFGGGLTIGDSDLTGNTGGNLLINNGSVFHHNAGATVQIAPSANSYGKIVVSGANSAFNTPGVLAVGLLGNGTLELNSGGSASAGLLTVGEFAGSIGSVVIGSGSTLNATFDARLGFISGNNASLTIASGGRLNVGDGAVAVTHSPEYSVVDDSSTDASDGGTLVVRNGSTMTNNSTGMMIGATTGHSGRVVLSGTGSTISETFTYVGFFGSGILNISSGGVYNSAGAQFGDNDGTATVTIDGAGSVFKSTSNVSLGTSNTSSVGTLTTSNGGGLLIGDNAAGFATDRMVVGDNDAPAANAGGKLLIFGGSTLTHHSNAHIAPFSGTFGSVLVSGANSRWDIGSNLFLGNFGGTANLQIEPGGAVTTTSGVVNGVTGPGTSAITVTGTNSLLAAGTTLEVGRNTTASLTISAGGKVTAQEAYVGHATAAGVGTLNLSGTGSRMEVTTLNVGGAGTGTVNLSGGTLKATTITRGASSTFSFTGGTLVAHTFTGQLTQSGGTLSPGDAGVRDLMTLTGGYSFNGGTLAVDLFTSNNDVIASGGPVSLAGVLALNNVSFPTTLDTNRVLIDAPSRTGVFSSVTGVQLSPTRFVAVTYNPNGVILKIARPGDADINGSVNFDDLLVLAQNYSPVTTGRHWALGDFNGSGTTDFDDLLLLAQNYGQLGLNTPTSLGSNVSPEFAADWALALATAPEPTSLVAVGATLVCLARRSRR